MEPIEIVTLIAIAAVTGSIAQMIVGLSKAGCFVSILSGFIGAWTGSWAAGNIKLPEVYILKLGEIDFPIFWSMLAAIAVTGFIAMFTPRNI